MTARRFSPLDQLIIGFDRGLSTLFNASTTRARRGCPGENFEEYSLTDVEKRHSVGLMRVNHSGEVSAQALYQGQGLTARDAVIRKSLQQSAIEEVDRVALRSHGFSDRDIWDIASVAAFFNMSNRMAAAVDMRPNDDYHAMAR